MLARPLVYSVTLKRHAALFSWRTVRHAFTSIFGRGCTRGWSWELRGGSLRDGDLECQDVPGLAAVPGERHMDSPDLSGSRAEQQRAPGISRRAALLLNWPHDEDHMSARPREGTLLLQHGSQEFKVGVQAVLGAG